jgi:hypothetical protein
VHERAQSRSVADSTARRIGEPVNGVGFAEPALPSVTMPGIIAAGHVSGPPDEEEMDGIIHKAMFERLDSAQRSRQRALICHFTCRPTPPAGQ